MPPPELGKERRPEICVDGTAPTEPDNIYQKIGICTTTGQRATEFCPPQVVQERIFEVYPQEYAEWAQRAGIPQPPREECQLHANPPAVELTSPAMGGGVRGRGGLWARG